MNTCGLKNIINVFNISMIIIIVTSCNNNIPVCNDIKLEKYDSYFYNSMKLNKNNIYINNTLNASADLGTFCYLKEWYSKDVNNIYIGNTICSVDKNSFEIMQFPYSKDRSNVYYQHLDEIKTILGINIIKNADPKSFFYISTEFTKDKRMVYKLVNLDSVIEMPMIDVKSFRKHNVIGSYIDTNYIYDVYGEIIYNRDTIDLDNY